MDQTTIAQGPLRQAMSFFPCKPEEHPIAKLSCGHSIEVWNDRVKEARCYLCRDENSSAIQAGKSE